MPIKIAPEPILIQRMVYEKEMKHSYKFESPDSGMPVNTIYIGKEIFANKPPAKIEIAISITE